MSKKNTLKYFNWMADNSDEKAQMLAIVAAPGNDSQGAG